LGNQLFCYAVARRLALVNRAELVIDDVTGFTRDRQYRRRYMLDSFQLPVRTATPAERLEPFERVRRACLRRIERRRPFERRRYLEHEGFDYDERLLSVAVRGTLYLDGLWLSDRYFRDAAAVIRQDLSVAEPTDRENQRMAEEMKSTESVALHVRWFDRPEAASRGLNISAAYYRDALSVIEQSVRSPHYFVFSDDPQGARAMLPLRERAATFVSHNAGDDAACADLWLMTKCRYFITANSTFSWWGAWLSGRDPQCVIAPDLERRMMDVRDSRELVPREWLRV
jgi:hypothetical protein